MITDAFIYHAQPVNATLWSFKCYIHPSSQRKTTDHEVNLLKTISSKLVHENINIPELIFSNKK